MSNPTILDSTTRFGRRLAGAVVCAALAGFAFAPAGCVSDSQQQGESDGSGWTTENSDTGTATGGGDGWSTDTDPKTDAGEREPVATTFRLHNETDTAVSIRQRGPCTSENPWLSLRDGESSVAMEESCLRCSCEDVESGGCGVCAIACPEQPRDLTLAAGESKEFRWDGIGLRDEKVDGQSCHRQWVPPKGRELTAEFCTVPGSTASGTADCQSVSFRYGEETNVTATVDAESEPVETTFELTNGGSSNAYLRPVGQCSGPNPWVTLGDGEHNVAFSSNCSICSCDDAESGECDVCGIDCPRPQAEVLEPGETQRLTWDGIGQRQRQVDGRACHKRWVPPRGRELEAEFCTVPGPNEFGEADCETVTFHYGEETTVSKTIGERAPSEKTFRLENESSEEIRIQPYSYGCTTNPPGWFSIERSGSDVTLNATCSCTCDQLEQDGGCAVCGRDGAPCDPDEMHRTVQPGESVEWTWSGYLYAEDSYDGQACLRKTTPAPGTSFEAEFCWEEYLEDKRAYDTRCTSRPFVYGPSDPMVETIR